MKTEVKIKCFDCGRPIDGKPVKTVRHTPVGSLRVSVCSHCQEGVCRVSKRELNQGKTS